MSSTFLRKKLRTLASDYGRLLRQILRHEQMLRGSFHQVYTRCGKTHCWCAQAKKGHPHTRLTWSEEGVMMTRKVGVSERKAVAKLTDAYKMFGEQRGQLTALHQHIQDLLDDYEKAVVRQSRKPLGLLPPKAPLSAKTRSPLQTRRLRQNPGRRKSFSP
jgi:Family of unknown function (DUF6788)